MKLILIEELLKWGILKRGYNIKYNHFQKTNKTKTNASLSKTNKTFPIQIKSFLKRTQTNKIIFKKQVKLSPNTNRTKTQTNKIQLKTKLQLLYGERSEVGTTQNK